MTPPEMPPPKFWTRRNPDRPTRGTLQGRFAEIWLGQGLMPWQQLVADVSGELDPVTRLPVYRLVIVTVQRQAGKSHLAMARKGERCFSVPKYRSWYTAQTGGDARDQFLKFNEQIEDAPMGSVVTTLVGNGREVMRFPNRSTIRPHPPTKKALHGKQSDDNDIDEAWAFTKEEGAELLQATSPTKLTRPGAQTFIWSAGGTAESTWLAELVARGRGGDPGICYFEWGIPDDADPEDLDVIAQHHPAFGYTITMDALKGMRTEFGDDPAGWARAAGNRWTEVIGGAIRPELWESVRHKPPMPDDAPLAYGAARSPDGTQVAIAVAARVDNFVLCEVIDVLPTSHGAADHIKAWAIDGRVAIATNGPSKPLVTALGKWARLMPVSDGDLSSACATLLDSLPVKAYRFRPHPDLDAAVAVLGKRALGDGGYVWARTGATAPIATMEACTLAAHALTSQPQLGKPRILVARG